MSLSLPGLLIVLAILAPNLLMFLLPPKGMPSDLKDAGPAFTVMERIGQAGCFVLPALLGGGLNGRACGLWLPLIGACVLVYWALWARYAWRGHTFRLLFEPVLGIPVPMAVVPVAAFGLEAVRTRSVWLGAAVLLLAVGHLANSWNTWRWILAGERSRGQP
jgi:hypothetical protein